MSVYIPGMEMPTSCFQCEFRTKIDPDNLMCIISQKTFEDRFFHIEHRDTSCPLVPVPKHGRLIDADAESNKIKRILSSEFIIRQNWSIDTVSLKFALKNLADATTIIPADPADKEGEG